MNNSRVPLNQTHACGRQGTMGLIQETAQVPVAPAPNVLGAGAIPTVTLVCSNCGNVRFHALGVIGLTALGNRTA